MANKWVYMFSEGDMTMRNLLGGKGANLAEMTSIGLPVPQGFTITTEACTQYYEDGRKINDEIMAQAMEGVKKMEEINGKKFGDLKNPLLVSVRSGARASMPGMMDTILNLGLNDEVVAAMIAGNPDPKFERFVYDSYRRFIQMFSDVVMEVGKKYFEQLIDKMKADRGVKFDVDLTAADLKELAEQFKAEYKNQLGTEFPSDPVEQLKLAIEAVFRSWDNPRANVYRRDNDIPYSWGTAVNVMPMVFGNLNNESGTGVAFTRDPATGENKLMGEFLINAQGEDVVAGVRTPMPIAQMEQEFPEAYADFLNVCETLENHYHDMQDMEFTVENKKLYMLQCRNGKRTAQAALQIACDLVDEGHKTEEEAVAMIDPRNLDTLLHPQFDAAALKAATPMGKGLGASPGAACGKVVFTADDAEAWAARGEKVVLVRLETSPEDITGMKSAQGILTVRGGMTSHAAVVARGMGTCCVSGCGDIIMDEENKQFTLAGKTFKEGDFISIDGTTGNIYDGAIKTVDATIAGEFGRVMAWADKYRTLKVRTNADTPADAKKARELGAIETHFANASGLYNPNHYTSAYDMAMIARGCYNNASFVNIDSTSSSYTIPATNVTSTPRTIKHRHKMLKGREFYYEYCKGGKTGFTDESLMTLVTFAEKDGMRLICVVFRSPDDSTRFIDTRSLFDWGFNNFKKSTTSDTQISSLFSTDNYYSSDVFNKSKLNFNMNASFITIPNSGSTSSVTMSLDKNYDITNEQGRLAAKLNYLYGDNVVGSTTLSITGGDNSNESLLPYLSAKNNSTQLSPKRCIKINIWVIAGIVAVILIIFTIINNASLSKKRSKYSKRKLRF